MQQPQRIWRINAYLILIAGVLAVGLMVAVLAGLVRDWLSPRTISNVVAPANDAQLREELMSYRLRNAQGDTVVLDVLADQRLDAAYYSSKTAADTVRNQVFVKLADGSSARLLADNRGLITGIWVVRGTRVILSHHGSEHDEMPEPAQPVRARLYEVVEQDSNGDARLSARDVRRLLLARADGSAPATLAEGIAQLHGATLGAANELRLVASQADGSTRLYRFDLQRWAALPPVLLPSLKES